MWDLPRPGLEPASPALAGRFSTTAPPGKPPASCFLPGVSVSSYLQLSLTYPSPAALILWPGPQRASLGLEFLSQLCCVTLGKLLDFSDPQFAPVKRKRLAKVLSEVLPSLSFLWVGKCYLCPAVGTEAAGAGWARSWFTSVATAETLDLDL